jgi:hypothetical protein
MVQLAIGQQPTGYFVSSYGAQINRLNDRVFLGSRFNGEFYYQNVSGLSPLAKALHYWGPRDSQLFVESSVGAMAIVGHTQSSDVTAAWPAYPTYKPAGIGVSGFAVNDLSGGSAWAGYFDAVRMPGAGFTPSLEICTANFGPVNNITPFNHLTGVSNSVNLWVQAGNGLDFMESVLGTVGQSAHNVNHSDAHMVFLTSYTLGTVTDFQNSKGYNVGDLVRDTVTQVVYRCTQAHTSPSTGGMAGARSVNSVRWKQRPAAVKGIVFTAGSLAELAPGANVFSAMEMHERTQISWWRGNASQTEQSAYIWADNIPMGKPTVGIRFTADMISFENANIAIPGGAGLWVGGKKVVGNQQLMIASPNADVNSLRTAVDAIRQLLANHGLMSPS